MKYNACFFFFLQQPIGLTNCFQTMNTKSLNATGTTVDVSFENFFIHIITQQGAATNWGG